jgi:hypothetical protein
MTTNKKAKAEAKKPAPPATAATALAKIRAEIDAIAPSDLAPINLDIPQAVSIALGAAPNLHGMHNDITKQLPMLAIRNVDELETYALAAWYAHLLAQPADAGPRTVKELDDEATPLRENLLSDAEALARRDLLPTGTVEHIRSGSGQVDKANDLVALSTLFSLHWDQVKDKTAATQVEVARAGVLGPLLLAALGVREHGVAPLPSDASVLRAKAFTLFVRAYDECRRAATFLRWHEDDADTLVPSLYKGRGGRGPGAPAEPPPAGQAAAGQASGTQGS